MANGPGGEPVSVTTTTPEQPLTTQQTPVASPEHPLEQRARDTTTQPGDNEQPVDNRLDYLKRRKQIVSVPPNNRKR
ncbi:hypothetical protein D3C85_1839300 [compost metagenome]